MSKSAQTFATDASVITPKGPGSVVSAAVKGWVPVELEDGKTHKFRASQLKIAKAADEGTRIRPDWDSLTKVQAASGKRSFDNADTIAVKMRGKTLEEVAEIASVILVEQGEGMTAVELLAKYSHLNPGHQRMCIGNKVRAAIKRGEDGVIRN
jgi:hypothetical protein